MSFVSRLRAIAKLASQTPYDPWNDKLARIKGRSDSAGIERISTQAICDYLEIPMKLRPNATRRISAIMIENGWSPIRMRGLTPGGFRDQVRGYARALDNSNC